MTRLRFLGPLLCAASVMSTGSAIASDAPASASAPTTHKQHRKPPVPVISTAFEPTGRLWRAMVRDGHVLVASSDDLGASFGPDVAVNPTPHKVWNDGENRPKIVADGRGLVHVTYTEMLDAPMAGHVRYARSIDHGRSFAEPVIVNDDRQPISHRFESLVVNGKGVVWVAWLDKRDQAAAKAAGRPYTGAALYYARSTDGQRFEPNVKLADHTCECCRVAAAPGHQGSPVVFWRHVFDGNYRDHALAPLQASARPVRVAQDGWQIEGCPHHGGAIAAGPRGVLHLAWYAGTPGEEGLRYARSDDNGRTFSLPVRFGDPALQPGRAALLAIGAKVVLAWKEFDGETTHVAVVRSRDGGRHWSAPQRVASASGLSDHPFLLARGQEAYLSWSVEGEAFRLRPIPLE